MSAHRVSTASDAGVDRGNGPRKASESSGSPTTVFTTATARNSTSPATPAAPAPPPTYYRLVVDGVEDDGGDFVKCAELIASVMEARLAYKNVDKGQLEDPVTVEEVNALAMLAPTRSSGKPTTGANDSNRSSSTVAATDASQTALTPLSPHVGESTSATERTSGAMQLTFEDGIYRVAGMRTQLVSWGTYVADIQKLYQVIESGPCLSTARSRLSSLAHKFQLYALMNAELEGSTGVNCAHAGAYVRSTKVDNALHMKTSMPAPVLLEFLARVAEEQPNIPFMDIEECNAVLVAAGLVDPKQAKKARRGKGRAGSQDAGNLAIAAGERWAAGGANNPNAGGGGFGAVSRRGSVAAVRNCVTLRQYLQAGGITDASVLTAEGLGLHPTLYRNKYLPYDVFSSQLNPSGPYGAKLLQALLSTNNEGPSRGDLCGSLIRAELEKREFKRRQPVATEMLLDISGVNEYEVVSQAAWARRQGFNTFSTNMWVLNIVPHFKKGFDGEGCAAASASSPAAPPGTQYTNAAAARFAMSSTFTTAAPPPGSNTMLPTCRTVGQQLRNLFYPLFMATLYPTDPQWSDVAQLLVNTGAVSIQTERTSRTQNLFTQPVHPDSVKVSLSAPRSSGDGAGVAHGAATMSSMYKSAATTAATSGGKEVADFYFFYYAWANLASLNSLRARFGLNTLNFNPSIQEQAPAYDQLACSFLLADNVYHATSLAKCWIMQYLYLYTRIGLVMSPLRDNAINVSFFDHPFVKYFQQGLQVSLSTSSPLHFHHRVDQPLLEEYSSLLKLRSLSPTDLCEVARNSVLNSNFPDEAKRRWLGELYTLIGCSGNDVARSNVCDARLQFRCESLTQEETVLNRVLAKAAEARSKPGGPPAVPKVMTIIAEASSPLRMAAIRATARRGFSSSSASSIAGLVVRGDGGSPLVLGTGAAAGAAAARRLRAIANTAILAEEGDDGGAVARGRHSRSRGGSDAVARRQLQQRAGSRVDPTDDNIDPRVSFPRVRISYGSGLDTGDGLFTSAGAGAGVSSTGGGNDDDEDDARARPASIAVYGANGKRSGYATVASLRQVLLLRQKYVNVYAADVNVEDVFSAANQLDEDMWEFNSYYGVVLLSRVGKSAAWPSSIPALQEFIRDLETVRQVASSTTLRRLAAHRLSLLEKKFQLHLSMNIAKESGVAKEKEWNNRDFFTAHKVDTNVQMESGHNAHTLLEFVVDKAVNHGEDVVGEDAELNPITLRMLLQHYDVRVETMTVDELHHLLDTHEDLRRTFLSPHNYMQGRYFAELSKRTLSLYQEDAYSFAENRLLLEGGSLDEWRQLSHWFDRYGMASSQSRWMVSIPREYTKLRASGKVQNFGEFLDNIFLPLWQVSLHPTKDTRLHYFLTHVSGFDSVASEESTVDAPMTPVHPHDWRSEANPPYNYYMYYLWANITSLNEFRASRGLGTFSFRPQCGELGGLDHLIGGYLVANGISHGVTLAKHPVLEYVFYLAQIGIAMSPLSNTAAASAYLENPFPVYFQRGLNVSLATNTPLYFHFTREPLIEEYSIAAKLWQLEFNDLSEIARNSVLQCGFPPAWKARALGQLYQLRSTLGNDVCRSRLSDIRVALRYECYHSELDFLDEQLVQPRSATIVAAASASGKSTTTLTAGAPSRVGQQLMPRAMKTLREEMEIYAAAMNRTVSGSRALTDAYKPRDGGEVDAARSHSGGETDGGNGGIPSSYRLARLLSRSAHDGLEGGDSESSSSSNDDEEDLKDDGAVTYYIDGGGCHCHHEGGSHPSSDTPALAASRTRQERRRQRQLVRQQRRELDRLESELRQLASISQQLSTENSAVASMISQMRDRLASEGLAILGGLVSVEKE